MTISIKEAIDHYIQNSIKKSREPFLKLLMKAVFAGVFIGMGAAGSSVAAHSVANIGIARLITGVVFPVGLMMVILLGGELFTGVCLMTMAIPSHRISWKKLGQVLATVYLGNFIGAAFMALLVSQSGQFDYSSGLLGAYTIKVAMGKVDMSFTTALISGVLCNILVCAAVLMAGCTKDLQGKLMASFFVIMLFAISGMEHCVANMYYITAGMIAKWNPEYARLAMEQYGINQQMLMQINPVNFIVKNLLPVTIGNILGGSVAFGIPLFYIHHVKEKVILQSKVKEVEINDNNDFNRSSGVAS